MTGKNIFIPTIIFRMQMRPDKTQTRRSVLKAGLATATAGFLSVGSVTASSSEGPISAEEAGVKKEINRRLNEGKTLEVLKLLEKYGVDYTATYNSLGGSERDDAISALSSSRTDEDSSGDVSTEDFFTKSDSNVTVYAFNLSGDLYRARIDFTVKAFDDAIDPDMPSTKDLIALGYSQPNEAMGDSLDYGMDNFNDSILSVQEKPVIDGPGAVISLSDGQTKTSQNTYRGYLAYDLDKDSSDEETIAGEYVHTWSAGNIGSGPTSSYSWSGLSIDVDPGHLNDKWELSGSDRF
ncbi:hypothetical protein C440_04963 [Haloferax mucosum ATCC BAA-1512]|uniref:Uncharacterized protein n=1 Tax=Haloferax mucosum ATCC BAA-1512 TaxID=662479 RepID=M0II79_9EURY|nr:hypothetical protein [Haloferax mucosum]ELZ96470.1 hypothetical protein C440_04963 [Haloferax mucosum ATCC BAA-1512]